MELLSDVLLAAATSPWVYLVVFAIVAIDGFFPPVPSESVVVVAAALGVSTGSPHPVVVVLVAAVGAATGDNLAYLLGRRIGTRRFRWMRRPGALAAMDRAARTLERRPASLLLVARYIPVGRVAVNVTAGATGFAYRRFLPLSVVAGICWAIYSVLIGMLAGAWVQEQPVLGAAMGVGLALVLGVVMDRVSSAVTRRRETSVPANAVRPEPQANRP